MENAFPIKERVDTPDDVNNKLTDIIKDMMKNIDMNIEIEFLFLDGGVSMTLSDNPTEYKLQDVVMKMQCDNSPIGLKKNRHGIYSMKSFYNDKIAEDNFLILERVRKDIVYDPRVCNARQTCTYFVDKYPANTPNATYDRYIVMGNWFERQFLNFLNNTNLYTISLGSTITTSDTLVINVLKKLEG